MQAHAKLSHSPKIKVSIIQSLLLYTTNEKFEDSLFFL